MKKENKDKKEKVYKSGKNIKKYRIELTEAQFNIVLRAINLMMRTGMGQMDDLTEWLATQGDNIDKFNTSTKEGKLVFKNYCITREVIKAVLDGVQHACWKSSNTLKSDSVLDLETIYLAFRHQQWADSKTKLECDVCSYEPTQQGCEPVPKIEKIEEGL